MYQFQYIQNIYMEDSSLIQQKKEEPKPSLTFTIDQSAIQRNEAEQSKYSVRISKRPIIRSCNPIFVQEKQESKIEKKERFGVIRPSEKNSQMDKLESAKQIQNQGDQEDLDQEALEKKIREILENSIWNKYNPTLSQKKLITKNMNIIFKIGSEFIIEKQLQFAANYIQTLRRFVIELDGKNCPQVTKLIKQMAFYAFSIKKFPICQRFVNFAYNDYKEIFGEQSKQFFELFVDILAIGQQCFNIVSLQDWMKQGIKMHNRIIQKQDEVLVQLINKYGYYQSVNKKYQQALNTFQQNRGIQERLWGKYCLQIGNTLMMEGICYHLLQKNKHAIEKYEQAILIYKKNNQLHADYAQVLYNFAIVIYQEKETKRAVKMFEEANDIFYETCNWNLYSLCSSKLAEIYKRYGYDQQSMRCLMKAFYAQTAKIVKQSM